MKQPMTTLPQANFVPRALGCGVIDVNPSPAHEVRASPLPAISNLHGSALDGQKISVVSFHRDRSVIVP
jgi:hypothetical protein